MYLPVREEYTTANEMVNRFLSDGLDAGYKLVVDL
jgi:hypothetical protein